jgi:hypothetical protein
MNGWHLEFGRSGLHFFRMKTNRYKVAAEHLSGKYKRGVVGRSMRRIEGRSGHVTYTLSYTWELESQKETYGVLRRKERKSYEAVRGHVFHLQGLWLEQPCRIRQSAGTVEAVSAVPGETVMLTDEQQEILAAAFRKWPGIEITNHGIEWVEEENDQTAQEFVLTIEGLVGVLEMLPTDRDGLMTRFAAKAKPSSMSGLSSSLMMSLGRGGDEDDDTPATDDAEFPSPEDNDSTEDSTPAGG